MTRLNYTKLATIQLALATLTTIGLSRTAAADDPPKPDATAPSATATATAAPEVPASRYPRDVIDRPLTLPAGLAMIGSDFVANHDFTAMAAAPIFGYGITDALEIQIPYAFPTKEFEAKGNLNLEVGYMLLRGALDGKLEVIARARTGYDFFGEVVDPLMLGLHVQYNATPKIAFISGLPGSQQLRIGVDGPTKPIDFSLPFGIGFQAAPNFYLELDTKLAQLNISNSANAFIGADTTPVALTVLYNAIPQLDIQAVIATDLSNTPSDLLTFLVGARYYAGKL